MRRSRLFWAGVLLVCWPGMSWGTPLFMERLPVSSSFRCLNCHTNQDPTAANAALNSFGDAFKENNFVWDRSLAELFSDGDSCSNGFELGDRNGDGILDPNVTRERNNPGVADCTLQLNQEAWSALKALFR